MQVPSLGPVQGLLTLISAGLAPRPVPHYQKHLVLCLKDRWAPPLSPCPPTAQCDALVLTSWPPGMRAPQCTGEAGGSLGEALSRPTPPDSMPAAGRLCGRSTLREAGRALGMRGDAGRRVSFPSWEMCDFATWLAEAWKQGSTTE